MKKFHNFCCFAIAFSCLCLTTNHPTVAQIIPDATLPNNSIAIPNGNSIRIEGGTTNGSNLFHSFQEFSVPTGSEAFFNNGLDIQNIFSRITGQNISNIDGLIRANGTANLFLINPNGIIFGQNAQLNIGGSFIGSTASSIRFVDGSEFSTTNSNAPSLLTVNGAIGLQFGEKPGSIVNRSQVIAPPNIPIIPLPIPNANRVGLAVQPGQTLALIGGDIQLDGGNLTASTGQIILGSVASPGFVSFGSTPLELTLNYDSIQNFGNIEISSDSSIDTTGLGGGKIDIRGGNVTISGSQIYSLTLGNSDGKNIDINAQNFRGSGGSQIFTLALGDGSAGAVNIFATNSLELIGIGFESYKQFIINTTVSVVPNPFDRQIMVLTSNSGSGSAGDITIATPNLLLRDGAIVGAPSFGTGNGGNITIGSQTADITASVINNGSLGVGAGAGGNITIDTQRLTVRDGGSLSSSTYSQKASGNITVRASESVEIMRTVPGVMALTAIGTNSVGSSGRAGDITIDTKRLIASEGAGITSASGTVLGNVVSSAIGGLGGNLTISATESVEVVGVSEMLDGEQRFPSFLSAQTTTASRGGDISIFTPRLTVRNGGVITAASLGAADAGDIRIDADLVEVQGVGSDDRLSSRIEASAGSAFGIFVNPNVMGNAGELNVNAREFTVKDEATVTVQSLGMGRAGNLNVVADVIALDNQGSIDGNTTSGAGANINLGAQNIQLRRNSRILTNAANSTGGNINISTDTLAALENSDITANAQQGAGGRVSIATQGIFGTQFRDELTAQSDITATSALGPQFSGTVEINTPDVDPSSGLVEISPNLQDVSDRIASSCPASGGNSFTVIGRGGLPADPTQTLTASTVWRDVRSLGNGSRGAGEQGSRGAGEQGGRSSQSSITEVTGWQRNQKGEVELVVNASGVSAGNPWHRVAGCSG